MAEFSDTFLALVSFSASVGAMKLWSLMKNSRSHMSIEDIEKREKREKTILICFGTRPEYIKVKSLIDHLGEEHDSVCKVKTCFTGQHGDLLDKDNLQNVDYNLEMHKEKIHELSSNRLNNITCNIMKHSHIFKGIDRVLVQGDTTTALAIALSAFNHGIAVVHLEAGLRSFDMANPYPEEMNRVIISRIADTHLCPTLSNKRNLLDEGVKEDAIFVVGNTGLDNIDAAGCEYGNKVLLTMHRRENLDDIPLWFAAFEELAALHPELEFMIPLHPNPLVQKHAHLLRLVKKCEPMTHAQTIGYLRACMMVISDSGGLQEECSFLKKKVVVCRKTTERPETLGSTSFLCGEATGLVRMAQEVINDYAVSAEHQCPYGDGRSWQKTRAVLESL